MSIITLLTDFGYQDSFVGVLKGVIFKINPSVQIVDITHNVPPQDIKNAGWQLFFSYKYFPQETIHLIVVDPGVGSKRNIILVKTKEYYFLAPDNGVLSYIIEKEKIEKIINVSHKKYFLKNISCSFQGRDILAAVAGHLSLKKNVASFGPRLNVNDIKLFKFPSLKKINENIFMAEIIYIDRFGNLLTNIPNDFLSKEEKFILQIKNKKISSLSENYSAAKNLIAIKGSSGFIEIALNLKSAAKILKVKIKEKVIIKKQTT